MVASTQKSPANVNYVMIQNKQINFPHYCPWIFSSHQSLNFIDHKYPFSLLPTNFNSQTRLTALFQLLGFFSCLPTTSLLSRHFYTRIFRPVVKYHFHTIMYRKFFKLKTSKNNTFLESTSRGISWKGEM